MNRQFRNYVGGDESQIIPLWNQCMARDPINLNKFRLKILLDENFDPAGSVVAESGKKIIGFSLAIRRRYPYFGIGMEEENGWITILFVHPDHRKKGIGSELLLRSEKFLKDSGVKDVLVSPYTPNYIIPGIDIDCYSDAFNLFIKAGYKKNQKAYSMGRSLLDFLPAEDTKQRCKDLEKNNIRIFSFESKYTVSLLEFLRRDYPGDLFRFVVETLKHHPECDNFFIAVKDSEVIGFSQFDGEHFGPLAITPEHGGKGIGTCLYHHTAIHMKEMGERNLWLAWTGGHAKDFYYKMGLRVLRRHEILKKTL